MADNKFDFTFALSFAGRTIPDWAMQNVGMWHGQISEEELALAWEPAPARPAAAIFSELEGAIKEAAATKVIRSEGDVTDPVIVKAADL